MDERTLLWVDLETTGPDPDLDDIIEVGAVLTDTALTPIAEFSSLVSPTAAGLARCVENPEVRSMHLRNGLLADLDALVAPRSPRTVQGELVDWLRTHGAHEGRTMLAGSAIAGFDVLFFRRHMPGVTDFCERWCLDISHVRRAHRLWGPPIEVSQPALDAKTHRALDDHPSSDTPGDLAA